MMFYELWKSQHCYFLTSDVGNGIRYMLSYGQGFIKLCPDFASHDLSYNIQHQLYAGNSMTKL